MAAWTLDAVGPHLAWQAVARRHRETAALEELDLAGQRDHAWQVERSGVLDDAPYQPRAQAVAVVVGPHRQRAHLAEVVPQQAQRRTGDHLAAALGHVELANALIELADRTGEQH